MSYSHIVVGGGIYGSYLALKLADIAPEAKILILEKEDDFFKRASYNNQARVHNGYHYPRSLLTALRSRVNFPHFLQEFPETVIDDFTKIYAIASQRSKVTANQFYTFCQRIKAEIVPAPSHIKNLFNPGLIDEVFLVKEYAFDARKLKETLKSRLAQRNVSILTNVEAVKIISDSNKNTAGQKNLSLLVKNQNSGDMEEYTCDYIYNCTYSSLNHLLSKSNLDIIPLRHEATEMGLIELPDSLSKKGITIMCGPFFSIMQFPDKGLSTFSHVSYTPHYEWAEEKLSDLVKLHRPQFPLKSNFKFMLKDAVRYLPALEKCQYRGSLWETKTILPRSDGDDSRPILFKKDSQNEKVISVLGGKIDNVFELDDALVENH